MNFNAIDHRLLDPDKFTDLSYDEDQYPYGWPWANACCYFYNPDEVPTELIQKCGFITGVYGEDYAVCGIDGGGYNLTDAHWIPLVLEYCKLRDIKPNEWLKVYYSLEVASEN